MGGGSERFVALFNVFLYGAVTVLLYLSLSGNDWARYYQGHSGFWHHCNSSDGSANHTKLKKQGVDDCHFIPVPDAADLLHVLRALYITGFIIWGVGLIYRRLTWRSRGTSVDHVFTIFVCVVILLLTPATALYTQYHYEEFVNNKKYVDVRYSFSFHLSITGCCFMVVLIVFTLINNRQNLDHSSYTSCSRTLKDCRCYLCLTLCKRQSSSVGSTSTSACSSSTELSSNGATTDASRGIHISTIASGLDNSNSIPARGRGLRSSLNSSRVAPADIIVRPPSYEEVSRDGSSSNRDAGTAPDLPPLPPSYEEATGNRELILSPPPAYSATVS